MTTPAPDGTSRGSRRRAIAGATAGLFFVYLLALSPHLVHHLFEDSPERGDECLFASSADRTEGTVADVLAPAPVHVAGLRPCSPAESLPAPDTRAATARAPPRSAS